MLKAHRKNREMVNASAADAKLGCAEMTNRSSPMTCIIAAILCMVWLADCIPVNPTPTRIVPQSLAGQWNGEGIFYNKDAKKSVFLIHFKISDDQSQIVNITTGYTSYDLLRNSSSYDGLSGGADNTLVHDLQFSTKGSMCTHFVDTFNCIYEGLELTGVFRSTILAEGTFITPFGKGNWQASPDGFGNWQKRTEPK
jgi:hypothetical protein